MRAGRSLRRRTWRLGGQVGGDAVEEEAEPEVELLVGGEAGGLGEPAGQVRVPAAGGGQVVDGGHGGGEARRVVQPVAAAHLGFFCFLEPAAEDMPVDEGGVGHRLGRVGAVGGEHGQHVFQPGHLVRPRGRAGVEQHRVPGVPLDHLPGPHGQGLQVGTPVRPWPGGQRDLGGCGYDVLGSEPASAARRFFDHLAAAGRDAFDLFSVHLYGDPACVPRYLDTARQFMRAHGYLKPVVVGEHGGPEPFEFPDATTVMQQVFAAAFAQAPQTQSTGELAARAGQQTPERRAMAALYDQMGDLPPTLQMFMAGCPADLEARRHRIACRQLAQRTLLALAGGVGRTAYWNLAPEYPGPVDHHQMMHLLIGKMPLLGYRDGRLGCRHPAADTFALLAGQLAGTQTVTRVHRSDRPALHAFEVDRAGRGPLLVLRDHRDAFGGEDEPPVTLTWPWPAATATTTDVFGQTQTIRSRNGQIRLPVSLTPLFITGHPHRP
jgi:hypothetical protein